MRLVEELKYLEEPVQGAQCQRGNAVGIITELRETRRTSSPKLCGVEPERECLAFQTMVRG